MAHKIIQDFRERRNAKKWKHENGGVFRYQEGTTKGGFNPKTIPLTDEQKTLAQNDSEKRAEIMGDWYRLNMREYVRAWYAERAKQDKYKPQLDGNLDKINSLLNTDTYVPWGDVITKLGGKKPVAAGGLGVNGGFVEANKSIDGKPFWFGKDRGAWWHEGIGHWLGEQVYGLHTKNPGTYMKYLGGFDNDQSYQNYINKLIERHADTWAFRGLNKDLKDANGNLYIDPNRQLTPEDVDEMKKNPKFRLPDQWKNTSIDSEGIADFHNTFAFVNKRPIPGFPVKQMAKEGAKIHKPDGHRAITDNGWIPTKRLKKGTYGLVKRNDSRK